MIQNVVAAYVLVGVMLAIYYKGMCDAFVAAGHSDVWTSVSRANPLPRLTAFTAFATLVVVAWPFVSAPSAQARDGQVGGP